MKILVLGGENCRFCTLAKSLLDGKKLPYEYKDVRKDDEAMSKLKDEGLRTVPQVWIDDKLVGGYTELHSYMQDLNKISGA